MRRALFPALVALLLPFSPALNAAPAALAAAPAAAVTAPVRDPYLFTLANNTSYIIVEVYVSDANSDSWGPDILGDQVLGPGEQLEMADEDFHDGECDYDIKVVWEDGSAHIIEDIDLCQITTVRYNG